MRGKPNHGFSPAGFPRNIPAYAGKTRLGACRCRLPAEHPRVCGKTCDVNHGGVGLTEHPRVCGENLLEVRHECRTKGTSPRMRGKRQKSLALLEHTRNIPAYAGKTCPAPTIMQDTAEHPRVCGENLPGTNYHARHRGTSPRMRGKRLQGNSQSRR